LFDWLIDAFRLGQPLAITLILEALEPKWGQGGECGV
jgi:hypothetical protein